MYRDFLIIRTNKHICFWLLHSYRFYLNLPFLIHVLMYIYLVSIMLFYLVCLWWFQYLLILYRYKYSKLIFIRKSCSFVFFIIITSNNKKSCLIIVPYKNSWTNNKSFLLDYVSLLCFFNCAKSYWWNYPFLLQT